MRLLFTVLALAASAALVSACGRPASTTTPSAETPVATPAELTPAQKTAILATLPIAYQKADLENGQAKVALCKSCHSLIQGGATMTGPNLWGVFGRKAGSVADYDYSAGLKASGVVWNAQTLDKWLTNPSAMVAGTKMIYLGIADATDRRDVIAYLKVSTTAPAK